MLMLGLRSVIVLLFLGTPLEAQAQAPVCLDLFAKISRPTHLEFKDENKAEWREAIAQIRPAQISDRTAKDLESYGPVRIVTWNSLNMLADAGKYVRNAEGFEQVQPGRLKRADLIEQAVRMYEKLDADIIALQEIEVPREHLNREREDTALNLKKFNDRFLGSKYAPIVFRGNDQRMQNGFLIKKDLLKHLSIKLVSHSHIKWRDPISERVTYIMARDLATIEVRRRSDPEDGPPRLVLLNTHLKSMRDRSKDPASITWRRAEVQYIAHVIERYRQQMGPLGKIIELGDHNGIFNPYNSGYSAEVFEALTQTGLVPAINVRETIQPKDSRETFEDRTHTHSYHPEKIVETPTARGIRQDKVQSPVYSAMDGILISTALFFELKGSFVMPYWDAQGRPIWRLPEFREDREVQASDHRPVVADFNSALGLF